MMACVASLPFMLCSVLALSNGFTIPKEAQSAKRDMEDVSELAACFQENFKDIMNTCSTGQISQVFIDATYDCAEELCLDIPCLQEQEVFLQGRVDLNCSVTNETLADLKRYYEEGHEKCLTRCVLSKLGWLNPSTGFPIPVGQNWTDYMEKYHFRGRRNISAEDKVAVLSCMYNYEHGIEQYNPGYDVVRDASCNSADYYIFCSSWAIHQSDDDCILDECRKLGYFSVRDGYQNPLKNSGLMY